VTTLEWCKLYSRYPDDSAIIASGEFAEVLFFRACAYATDKETKGFIPAYQPVRFGLHEIKRLPESRLADRIAALVENQLWLVVDGGWKIRNYERLQAELTALMRKREADRERQRRRRESRDESLDSHTTNRAISVSVSGCVTGLEGETEIEIDSPQPPASGGRRCTRHKARPKTNCADCQLPANPTIIGPACGNCSPSRRLEDEHGGDLGPCPDCHPSRRSA
jgi:hypothetical protein